MAWEYYLVQVLRPLDHLGQLHLRRLVNAIVKELFNQICVLYYHVWDAVEHELCQEVVIILIQEI